MSSAPNVAIHDLLQGIRTGRISRKAIPAATDQLVRDLVADGVEFGQLARAAILQHMARGEHAQAIGCIIAGVNVLRRRPPSTATDETF